MNMGKSWVVVAVMMLVMVHPSLSCKKKELEALTKFKKSFTHDPNGLLSSWVGDDCCHWSGVTCDDVTSNVIKLDLSSLFSSVLSPPEYDQESPDSCLISSELSPALLELEFLTYLHLSGNNFSGSQIPKFIGSMTNLEYLRLDEAGFSGAIPQEIGNLTNLNFLDLSFNGVYTGNSMKWASGLSKLQKLRLAGMDMFQSDDALRVLLRLPSLSGLFLEDCGLHKTHLTELLINNTISSPLRVLVLSDNNLEGPFPSFLQNMSSLEYLSLQNNSFSGSLPPWLGNMSQLGYLTLSDNKLSGRLPPELGHLTNLVDLFLSNNGFQGPVPSLAKLSELTYLDLSSNNIYDTVSDISNLSKLYYLDLSFNNIDLNLDFRRTPSYQIQFLRVQSCTINMMFPKWLRNQTQLNWLDFTDTGISGEFPKWILNNTNLGVLELGHNQLTALQHRLLPGFGTHH